MLCKQQIQMSLILCISVATIDINTKSLWKYLTQVLYL